MQLGNQHPGGIGVPAMGMALPGYVAQPQLGFGNSEMTWYEYFVIIVIFMWFLHIICFDPYWSYQRILVGKIGNLLF